MVSKNRRVSVLHVDKVIPDSKMSKFENTFVKPSQIIHDIITTDTDVYTDNGKKLLLKFRKKRLSKDHLDAFYNATFEFTSTHVTRNRGSTQGSKKKNISQNAPIKSSILGYFDRWGPSQKACFKNQGVETPLAVRETLFSEKHPDKMKQATKLIKDIDDLYKELLHSYYLKQAKKARQTEFKIANTSFTTITTNINFQTSIHKDKGDDGDGFGNLTVIQRGDYTGGETCLPQYGIGVDVREGDMLFMDVHEWHSNLPIKLSAGATRMSVVCYLRTDIWRKTKDKPKGFKDNHLAHLRNIFGSCISKRDIYKAKDLAKKRETKKRKTKKRTTKKRKRN